MRTMRNQAIYDVAGLITEKEARSNLKNAAGFVETVKAELRRKIDSWPATGKEVLDTILYALFSPLLPPTHAIEGDSGQLRLGPLPNTNRARSLRSISNGVTHFTPRPIQTLGILTFRNDSAGTSCVTTICEWARAWAIK